MYVSRGTGAGKKTSRWNIWSPVMKNSTRFSLEKECAIPITLLLTVEIRKKICCSMKDNPYSLKTRKIKNSFSEIFEKYKKSQKLKKGILYLEEGGNKENKSPLVINNSQNLESIKNGKNSISYHGKINHHRQKNHIKCNLSSSSLETMITNDFKNLCGTLSDDGMRFFHERMDIKVKKYPV